MESISAQVGIPPDQLALVGGLLLSVLLSFIMKQVASPSIKIWMNIIFGTFLQWALYKQQIFYSWIETLIIYLMCKYLPRKKIAKWVIIQSGIYLLFIQLKRYISSVTTQVDVTAVLMISITKFITFAFCYQDGAYEVSELNYPKQQGPRKIDTLPSFWTYLGYMQFIPTAMIGPTFQYSDYINYIHKQRQYANIPSSLYSVLGELRKSIFFIIVFLVLDSVFKVDYLISGEYIKLGFIRQFVYVIIVIVVFKFKYYTAWSLSTLGVKASGISYQKITEKDGKQIENFQKIQYANPIALELNPSFKVKIDSWNICVQVFFKRYLYQRLLSEKDQSGPKASKLKKRAQQLTLLYSTFWHGFYPGYLLSFFHWMLLFQVTQELFRVGKSNPRLLAFYKNNKIVRYLVILVSSYAFSWIGVFFHLYHLDKIWIFSSIHWYVQLALIYVCYILIVQMKILSPKTKSQKNRANQPKQQKKEGEKETIAK